MSFNLFHIPPKVQSSFRAGVLSASSAALLLAGCQTYHPQAASRPAHKKEWEEREASSESVRKFANVETFLFSKTRDNQLIMTCIDCLKVRFELFRIDPDLRLKFVRSVAELATGAFEMDSLSIRALGAGVSVPDSEGWSLVELSKWVVESGKPVEQEFFVDSPTLKKRWFH
ncbi:MAG: hypothetical protein AAF357_14275, partial [Verrucomicrobiota bacterium]